MEILVSIISMKYFVLGPIKYSIAHREHSGNGDNLLDTLILLGDYNTFGQLRITGELGHASTQFGQLTIIV